MEHIRGSVSIFILVAVYSMTLITKPASDVVTQYSLDKKYEMKYTMHGGSFKVDKKDG